MWKYLFYEKRWLMFSGIIGFALFVMLFSELSLTTNKNIFIHKRGAIKLAKKQLHQFGYESDDFHVNCDFGYSNIIRMHLQHAMGRDRAVDSLRNSLLSGDVWRIYFSKKLPSSQPEEAFSMEYTTDGILKRYEHIFAPFPDSVQFSGVKQNAWPAVFFPWPTRLSTV